MMSLGKGSSFLATRLFLGYVCQTPPREKKTQRLFSNNFLIFYIAVFAVASTFIISLSLSLFNVYIYIYYIFTYLSYITHVFFENLRHKHRAHPKPLNRQRGADHWATRLRKRRVFSVFPRIFQWSLDFQEGSNNTNVLGCPRKLGSMVSKWVTTPIYPMYK